MIFLLTMSISDSNITALQAKNIEIHIGKGTSEMFSADHISITRQNSAIQLNNETMDIAWQDDQLHIYNETEEIWLPFITQSVHNDLNQYHFNQMNINFEIQKYFQMNFRKAELKLKDNLYILNNFRLSCHKKSHTKTSSVLESCLTDKATMQFSSLAMDSSSVSNLKKFLFIKPLKRSRHQSKQESDIQNAEFSIQRNAFKLEMTFQGKSISMSGKVYHDSTNSQLKLIITKAKYFFVSIKGRVYKKIRALKSSYISVDQNDVITIKIDQL